MDRLVSSSRQKIAICRFKVGERRAIRLPPQRFPEIDLTINKVGVFGRLCKLDQVLKTGDRVEIYRPLLVDPKEMRRTRAAKR